MVSLVNNTINPTGIEGGDKPIGNYEVWFSTPYGLFKHRERAIQRCDESDLNPELCVKPVVVAVATGDELIYEVI